MFRRAALLGLLSCASLSACSSRDEDGADAHDARPNQADPDASANDTDAGDIGVDATGPDGGRAPLPTGKYTIGFWCGPPASELTQGRMDEMAAAGFTHVSNACERATEVPAYNQKMLDLAAKSGLVAIVTDARVNAAFGSGDTKSLGDVVKDYAGAPNLYGYHVVDEPAVPVFGRIGAVVSELKKLDPVHPGIVNLLPTYGMGLSGEPNYSKYVGGFLDVVKPAVYSYDHYNFLSDGTDNPDFFDNLAIVRERSLASKTPFWQYIQSISYVNHRPTNEAEKRWAALHTMVYGGAGVMYFTYWTPPQTAENFGEGIIGSNGKPSSQYAEVRGINGTLAAFGKYLAPAVSKSVFHVGPLDSSALPRVPGDPVYVPSGAPITVGLFEVGDEAYAMLVNRSYKAKTDADVFLASADGNPEILDVATQAFVPVTKLGNDATAGTKVHVSLPPGDGVLFHLRGPLPKGAPGAQAFVGTVRGSVGTLNVVDESFGGQPLRSSGWDECPKGYKNVGRLFQDDGFWLCAREDLADRAFHLGNVVSNSGSSFRVQNGVVSAEGPSGWDACANGSKLLGHVFTGSGFWLCRE